MCFCRHRLFCLVVLVTLSIVPAASPAMCQTVSRPAAVLLVATLETVSVRADSPAASSVSFANGAPRVTITTAVAVPANCTTVRMAGRLDAAPEPPSAVFDLPTYESSATSEPATGNPARASVLRPGEGEVALFSQPAGHTNWPISRTDDLDLQLGPASRAAHAPASSSGTLDILVQAL